MEQIDLWRQAIEKYKTWYKSQYKHDVSPKLIESFCNTNKIPWPLPKEEECEIKEPFTTSVIDISYGGEVDG